MIKNNLKRWYNQYLQKRQWNHYVKTQAWEEKKRELEIEKFLFAIRSLPKDEQEELKNELLQNED